MVYTCGPFFNCFLQFQYWCFRCFKYRITDYIDAEHSHEVYSLVLIEETSVLNEI